MVDIKINLENKLRNLKYYLIMGYHRLRGRYRHTGDAVDRLLHSYQGDEEKFRRDTTIPFPERRGGYIEVRLLRELFFPSYWNCGFITKPENRIGLEVKINELGQALFNGVIPDLLGKEKIEEVVDEVLGQLPDIREILKEDVQAAFGGDPSAVDPVYTEIIRAYPGFMAIMVQRVAHVLYELGVPSYSRKLTEHAHTLTGADIHPGAKIGEYFFIDHATGVVIGETSEIGNHVRMYQGVTLGALHFEKAEGGVLKKGYKRHPTIGNNVVIGMGAKIVGPVRIGNNVSIGANSWIQEDVPDDRTVFISEHPRLKEKQNTTKNNIGGKKNGKEGKQHN